MTFYQANINSGPKITIGNFSLELIFTKQKVKKLRGGEGSRNSQENFYFFSFDGLPYRKAIYCAQNGHSAK